MSEEFRAEVNRFADAVQRHIPNEMLYDWLFAHMPRAIPKLNLGPNTKAELALVKKEPSAEAGPPGTVAEAGPPTPALTLDEQVAQRGLSPQLFAWQIPELVTCNLCYHVQGRPCSHLLGDTAAQSLCLKYQGWTRSGRGSKWRCPT